MAKEVEMKARIADPDQLLALLDSRYEYIRSYQKSDLYLRGRTSPDAEPVQMRLREDDGQWHVTFKEKTLVNGMEVNQEDEYPLADPQVVETVARRLGWQEYVRKVKKGRQYRDGNALYEMSLVDPLGWFLEIEIVLEDDAAVEQAQTDVRRRFKALGIPESAIEGRYYTEMLLAARSEAEQENEE